MNKGKYFRKFWETQADYFTESVERFNTSFELEERTLRKLFDMKGEDDEIIFTRVIVLNQLYSAGLTDHEMSEEKAQEYEADGVMKPVSVRRMADHIIKNKERLKKLIEEAEPDEAVKALMEVSYDRDGRRTYRSVFSFATKYCSWCKPEKYPIIDQYVEEFLYRWYHDISGSQKISHQDFDICENTVEALQQNQTYKTFSSLVEGFQKKNGLTDAVKKEVDKFIWTSGKDWFSYWDTAKRIISINEYAVDYYHQQLIARRDKFQPIFDEWELSDEIIEQYRIGLADDDEDNHKLTDYLMSKGEGFTFRDITDSGLIKEDADNAGVYSDVFYGRIIFPIFAKTGEPVSMVGRTYLSLSKKVAIWLWPKHTPVFSQKDKKRCSLIDAACFDGREYVHERFGSILNLGNLLNL